MTGLQLVRGSLLALLLATCGAARHDDDARDAQRLIQVLDAAPGSVLADVGAGDDAPLTIPLARHVGASGRVYATEVGARTVARLRRAIERAGLRNVVVVEGHPRRTNLPAACCDGIFMRNVYHHFAHPQAMNASLHRALRPDGRLAILDFPPEGREAATPGERDGRPHGVGPESVARELTAAGFEVIATERREDDAFLIVAKKRRQ